eukprot:736341-Hanusia_phi.AAC.5
MQPALSQPRPPPMQLLDLPEECLLRLWPGNRVLLGLQAVKGLRGVLGKDMEEGILPLVLVSAQMGCFDSAECDETLARAVRVVMRMRRHVSLQLGGSGPHAVAFVYRLFEAGFEMRQICSLSLSRNKLSCKDLGPLIAPLKTCTGLQCLDLSFNSIDTDDISNLIATVELRSLLSVDLSHNACGGWFHQSQRQRLIDFAACGGFDSEPARAHEEWRRFDHLMRTRGALPSYLDPLHTRRGVGDAGLHLLAAPLSQLPRLSRLDLVRRSASLQRAGRSRDGSFLLAVQKVTGAQGESVCLNVRCTTSCRNLSMVSISSNSVTDVGVSSLLEALKRSEHFSLTVLDLHDNSISDKGVKKLAEVLRICESLAQLYLGRNVISDFGAQQIAKALPTSSLQVLDLGENRIMDDGATALAGQPFLSLLLISSSSCRHNLQIAYCLDPDGESRGRQGSSPFVGSNSRFVTAYPRPSAQQDRSAGSSMSGGYRISR